jgi:ribonuclease III
MRPSPRTLLSLAQLARPSSIPLRLQISAHRAFRKNLVRRQNSNTPFFEFDLIKAIAADVATMSLPDPLPALPEISEPQTFEAVFSHTSSLTFSGTTHTRPQSNERLEFLGDSYVNFCVAAILYRTFPDMSPGDMTTLRASIVSNTNLCRWGKAYKFQDQLRVGSSMQYLNLAEREKQIADCFEAYVGGVIISNVEGSALIYKFLEAMVQPTLEEQKTRLEGAVKVDKQSVSKLYELAQKRNVKLDFEFQDMNFPGASDRWEAICMFNGEVLGRARAKNQQDAKQLAAAQALNQLFN